MLRQQPQNVIQGFLPVGQGLAGEAVHQIHGYVPETRLPDPLVGGDRLGVAVGTAQLFQHFVVVGLDAKTGPVKALGTEPVQ